MGTGAFPLGGSGGGQNQLPNFDWKRLGFGEVGMGGSNQWGSFPSMTSGPTNNPSQPGIVPSAQGFQPIFGRATGGAADPNIDPAVGWFRKLPGGAQTGPTLDPRFTQAFDSWLRSQMGQGASPFNLSAILPSTGKATEPGTLTAPMNPIEQLLQQFYKTGEGGPMAGVLPMWQSAMKAMEQPEKQAEANLREQFAFAGGLDSSPFGTSMANFQNQAALNKEALLGQLTLQALPGMQEFANVLQGMDQSSIDRLFKEFVRTRPEYSPLLQEMFGLATTFPPIVSKKGGIGAATVGSLGGILSGAGGLL